MLDLSCSFKACDMCRKKKIKCDGKLPACTHCINYKTDCVFTQVEKKRAPPKGCASPFSSAANFIASYDWILSS